MVDEVAEVAEGALLWLMAVGVLARNPNGRAGRGSGSHLSSGAPDDAERVCVVLGAAASADAARREATVPGGLVGMVVVVVVVVLS